MTSTEKQLTRYSENPASGFPLTDGDLVAFAETWWNDFIDNDLFVTLTGQSGSELYDRQFAADRLDRIAAHLGTDAVERIREYVEEFWKRKVGSRHWDAYKAGLPIIQDEASQRSEKVAERAGGNDAPGDRVSDCGDWSNAETAAFHRWITTDPDIRTDWRHLVAALRGVPEAFPTRREVREALARDLREQAAEEWRWASTGLLSDLLDIAFSRVDWPELADALLSESEADETPKYPQPENEP